MRLNWALRCRCARIRLLRRMRARTRRRDIVLITIIIRIELWGWRQRRASCRWYRRCWRCWRRCIFVLSITISPIIQHRCKAIIRSDSETRKVVLIKIGSLTDNNLLGGRIVDFPTLVALRIANEVLKSELHNVNTVQKDCCKLEEFTDTGE